MSEIMLRTSERNLFKRCQWAWERNYVDRLENGNRFSTALWFGTGIHLALEKWYIPGTERGVHPVETWKKYCDEARGNTTFINTYMDGDFSEAVSALELGTAMLNNYVAEYGLEPHIEVISAEQTFNVGIRYEEWIEGGTNPAVGNYVGTFDLVWRDLRDGKLYLTDHKGLRMSEKVLTPEGWTANGDLKVGDEVIGSDGRPTKVTGVYDLGKRQMYRVHMADGSYVDTTDDHLWTVRHGSREKVRTTLELKAETEKEHQNWCVTLPDQPLVDWTEKTVPIDPYVLGVLIGDGCLRDGARVTNPDDYILDRCVKVYGDQVHVGAAPADKCRTFGISGLAPALRKVGLLGKRSREKFIPENYLYGSIRQRKALLAGLLDTDGHIDTHHRIKFCTTSDRLKDDVEFLVRSLGGRAQSSSYEAYHTKDGERVVTGHYWHVSIRMMDCPFNMPRHVERFQPPKKLTRNVASVEVIDEDYARCIRVEAEDSLYLTKDCIVTHNTTAQLGASNTQYLPLDDQAGAYMAVANHTLREQGLIGDDERISGIVYNYLVKRKPDLRPRNADGFCTNKPQKKHFVAQLTGDRLDKMKLADLESLAAEQGVTVLGEVSAQQPSPLLERKVVYRSALQNRSQIHRVGVDMAHMSLVRNNLLEATKTPTRECGFCQFRDICELDEQGKDWSEYADMVYRHWEPYGAHTHNTPNDLNKES